MKIGLLGDIHARVRAPAGRQDDWFVAQLGKFVAAMTWFKEQECELILQPGDFFDAPRPVNFVMSTYINTLTLYNIRLFAVLGQHDTYYHDVVNSERTALNVLQAADVAHLISADPALHGNIRIYGASWGQEPPVLRRKPEGTINILVAHASVGDKPLWPGHKLPSPGQYAKDHPGYDLILLGDYHYSYQTTYKDTTIVNMGCMMRMRNTPKDRDHKPRVGIYDTEKGEIETMYLPIEPSVLVFATAPTKSEPSEPLQEFLDRLRDTGVLGTSFTDNLQTIMKEKKANKDVRGIADDIMKTVGAK